MHREKLIDKVKAIVCALMGHSRIQEHFFGYFYCGRCGEKLGDALGSVYPATSFVIIRCGCHHCERVYEQCTWRDKLLVPDPFEGRTRYGD